MTPAPQDELRVPATILSLSDGRIRVLADAQNGCQACAEGRGCGGGVLGKLIAARRSPLEVPAVDFAVREQQRVWLVMNAQLLQKLAFLTWGLPVVALVVAALLSDQLPSPAGIVVGGLVFSLGLFAPRIAARRLSLRSLRIEPESAHVSAPVFCVSALD